MIRYVTSDGKKFTTMARANAHIRRVSDRMGYGLSVRVEDYDRQRRSNSKKKKSASKRIGAALSQWLKKQNPGKMRGVTHVRVRKLKGGGVTVSPVRHR